MLRSLATFRGQIVMVSSQAPVRKTTEIIILHLAHILSIEMTDGWRVLWLRARFARRTLATGHQVLWQLLKGPNQERFKLSVDSNKTPDRMAGQVWWVSMNSKWEMKTKWGRWASRLVWGSLFLAKFSLRRTESSMTLWVAQTTVPCIMSQA